MIVTILYLALQLGPCLSFTLPSSTRIAKTTYGQWIQPIRSSGVVSDLKMVAVDNQKTAVDSFDPMRPPFVTDWSEIRQELKDRFDISEEKMQEYDDISKEDQLAAYKTMQICRQFENACMQAYMQGHIRGFMHLDNGQESIPAIVGDRIKKGDLKYSYYREHTHALASGVSPHAVMAELYGKDTGTCRGAGGSMHIFDTETNFQGGWALVAEQLSYATGAARSIVLDRFLKPDEYVNDDRISIVFVGEGGALNGRMAECMNAAAKEKLPILFLVIDNGRAINTFSPDVAKNSNIFDQGKHYEVPGVKINGQDMVDSLRAGRAVIDYVRTSGPAVLQVHTYRFNGHSPADPEHERGRKDEKRWARAEQDPIARFEQAATEEEGSSDITTEELDAIKNEVKGLIKEVLDFSLKSDAPPPTLAKDLEYPDAPDTDYNSRVPPSLASVGGLDGVESWNQGIIFPEARAECDALVVKMREMAEEGTISIGDAVNLAILEEMLRDPMTTIKAEDLQAGSSYNIPRLTQQTFGTLRAADEIIDEGHFIGKALGEGMNGYRPIVELMNANFGIYGMAELSSAGNTYATTGGQFKMPMTIIGAGGTAPNQALGAEHSQPFHAYVMGIPGLKICTASSPDAAYGLTKSMIRDDGPGILFLPVKMMKESKGYVALDRCDRLDKSVLIHEASASSVEKKKAVTVLTYLHGVKESQMAIEMLKEEDPEIDIDLIELRTLKPFDLDTVQKSLQRTHRLAILDESTLSGGVGATISALVSEKLYYELDGPIKRLCMDDAPVPYASSMEKAVVKRSTDLVEAVMDFVYSS